MSGRVAPRPGLADLVAAWAKSIEGTPHVPMTRVEQHQLLQGLAGRLVMALYAEPFDPMAGYRVATDLVASGYDTPEALGRSLAAIEAGLVDQHQGRDRLGSLLQHFATGFARAMRDRTLDAQEEIRMAALAIRLQAERELRNAALYDPLTGLPSRVLFHNRLQGLCSGRNAGSRLGVCHIGLDGLDAAKISLGPSVGDRLLQRAASRLQRFTAEVGHLGARWGDDQFAILVEHTSNVDDVVKVADRVLARLADPYRVGELDLSVPATAGIVEMPAADADPTEVMRAADLARHWAVTDGKPWMVFEPRRSARELERYRLSAELPAAISRDEFVLDYQPLVELRTGTVAGLEALVRWRHPTLGRFGPDRFIGLAEDTGMINTLGLVVLENACRHAIRWSTLVEPAPYVSVNLAVAQVRRPGLVAAIAAILDRTGLPPHRLQLEILESVLIDPGCDVDRATVDTLRAISRLGVHIVIDDFGTGYSNFAYLPTLPLHGLKLARTFLVDHLTPAGDRILADLVMLGHELGLTITGEGVETAEHARRLTVARCDLGQGWHLGRPVAADRVPDMLTAGPHPTDPRLLIALRASRRAVPPPGQPEPDSQPGRGPAARDL